MAEESFVSMESFTALVATEVAAAVADTVIHKLLACARIATADTLTEPRPGEIDIHEALLASLMQTFSQNAPTVGEDAGTVCAQGIRHMLSASLPAEVGTGIAQIVRGEQPHAPGAIVLPEHVAERIARIAESVVAKMVEDAVDKTILRETLRQGFTDSAGEWKTPVIENSGE